MNPFTVFFDMIWSFPAYPALTYAEYFQRPDTNLQRYDERIASTDRRVTLFAGTDAHSNIGFHIFGDDAGNKLINLKLDRYETIFRLARLHVLLGRDRDLTRENLNYAVKQGNAFVGLDAIGDSTGFTFEAGQPLSTAIMGDEVSQADASASGLKAAAPLPGRFVVFRNGEKIYESDVTSEIKIDPTGPGAYRVEVYRDDLGPPFDKMPWILSNPIYVR